MSVLEANQDVRTVDLVFRSRCCGFGWVRVTVFWSREIEKGGGTFALLVTTSCVACTKVMFYLRALETSIGGRV